MSATRRVALVVTLALVTVVLSAAAALAQGGSPNPSGGTSCRLSYEERGGSIGLTSFFNRGLSFDLGLQSWLNGFAVTRFVAPPVGRGSGRTPAAVTPRRVWGR